MFWNDQTSCIKILALLGNWGLPHGTIVASSPNSTFYLGLYGLVEGQLLPGVAGPNQVG